jgi:two-component system, chemotaxis family, response regulator Rcp1
LPPFVQSFRYFLPEQCKCIRKHLDTQVLTDRCLTCLRPIVKKAPAAMDALRILLVEDSPSDVRLIREALKETPLDVQITLARDGIEAMEYLHQSEVGMVNRPDIILLDLNLPRKNGREVLAEVKATPRLKQIPILIMTSSKADEDVKQAYNLNANCYIAKPGNLQEYVDVVRSIENFWFITATLPDAYVA